MSGFENPASIDAMRNDALVIFRAGIEAADPYQAVKRCLCAGDGQIEIRLDSNDSHRKRLGGWSKIHLMAFGKAACPMARAAQEIIPEQLLAGRGIAVTNHENVTAVDRFEVIGASHPLPDAAGLEGAKLIAAQAVRAQKGEMVLVLVSGGGSALIPCPTPDITLEQKIATTGLLLACGADIDQINCVRKHLSRIKGGGLARMSAPADLHALILSDVLGDDPSAIASGPTVPDATTFADAIHVLESRGVWDRTPADVRHHLEQGRRGNLPETPKSGDSVFANTGHTLIGSNAISVGAIMKKAEELGYQAILYSDHLCGEARDEAEKWVIHARRLLDNGATSPLALLAGGETTVTLKGNGRGGRNQEMALAFACAAERHGLAGDWTFLSGGTDGRDGPTDAAGGLVDPGTLMRMRRAGIEPTASLDNNDAYTALKNAGDLLDTGATGTNVADLQVLLIHPRSLSAPGAT